MSDLNTTYQIAAIAAILGGAFSFSVLRPLNNAITELKTMVGEVREDLRESERRRQQLEIKLAEVDQRSKALHTRLDNLAVYMAPDHQNIPASIRHTLGGD